MEMKMEIYMFSGVLFSTPSTRTKEYKTVEKPRLDKDFEKFISHKRYDK